MLEIIFLWGVLAYYHHYWQLVVVLGLNIGQVFWWWVRKEKWFEGRGKS